MVILIPPGLVHRNPGEPINGRLSAKNNIDLAKQGKQYKGELLNSNWNKCFRFLDDKSSPLGATQIINSDAIC